ncbi:MAG: hypothetical protein NT005_08265, partial [Spirochaetes bacterium]|nr:hypothetical protein [Spirochaetota bacterium]
LDWKLPVVTAKYEVAGGASEDEEDGTLVPNSTRNTVSLRIKEDALPAGLGLTLRYSVKDYVEENSDYSYIQADQDTTLRLSPLLKLGAAVGGKYATFGQLDAGGLSKDYLALKGGLDATFSLAKGTSLDAGLDARFSLAEEASKSKQAYTVSTGFSSRLGEWTASARYRGEFRFSLGAENPARAAANNQGSFSLQWDPNR